MSITATVRHGSITLPPGLNIENGSEVEILVPATALRALALAQPVSLPAFNGGGLHAGINLDDLHATRRLLDESNKFSQLP